MAQHYLNCYNKSMPRSMAVVIEVQRRYTKYPTVYMQYLILFYSMWLFFWVYSLVNIKCLVIRKFNADHEYLMFDTSKRDFRRGEKILVDDDVGRNRVWRPTASNLGRN